MAETISSVEAFAPLLALAKARTVALVDTGGVTRDDGEFLLRALIDLESDGVELFGEDRQADDGFYAEIAQYLGARVGATVVARLRLDPWSVEALAIVSRLEGPNVARLLCLPGVGPSPAAFDRAIHDLVKHPEVNV